MQSPMICKSKALGLLPGSSPWDTPCQGLQLATNAMSASEARPRWMLSRRHIEMLQLALNAASAPEVRRRLLLWKAPRPPLPMPPLKSLGWPLFRPLQATQDLHSGGRTMPASHAPLP